MSSFITADPAFVRTVRSGLTESRTPVEVVAIAADGNELGRWGSLDRRFFMRSAAKPFQAWVSQSLGADLVPEQLAVAAASHSAEPVHLAYVAGMLGDAGLDESMLACPPDHPLGSDARDLAVAMGRSGPRRILHNCSGKHAAMLRACAARRWSMEGYTDPEHPLQQANVELMAEVTGEDPGPVGVDGCGVPTFRTSVAGLARAFARLAHEQRFRNVWTAMHRYPALVSGTDRPERAIVNAVDAAAKGGAQGCIGVAVRDRFGIAAKADDGSGTAAAAAGVGGLGALGMIGGTNSFSVDETGRPTISGGGAPVGMVEFVSNGV